MPKCRAYGNKGIGRRVLVLLGDEPVQATLEAPDAAGLPFSNLTQCADPGAGAVASSGGQRRAGGRAHLFQHSRHPGDQRAQAGSRAACSRR